MIFGQDRGELRRMYATAWARAQGGEVLAPLDAQIADVVRQHPEYQRFVEAEQLDRDFLPEDGQTNPFLHMGLHLALREQVSTDRPAGIAAVYRRLTERDDAHDVEHRMIDCLAETLWEAQSANALPDEARYLERLRTLLRQAR